MKFHKSSAPSSPKMELLRRQSGGNRMSSFKRSKSFRASVKLITKIRNHANLHVSPSYDLTSFSYESKDGENFQGKMHNLSSVSEDLEAKLNNLKVSVDVEKENCETQSIDSLNEGKMSRDFESKLSLTSSNAEMQKVVKEREKLSKLSVKMDEFNAYENPMFMDSSLESSVLSCFYEDDLDELEENVKVEKMEKSPLKAKNQCKTALTVIVESGQVCRAHDCCTCVKNSSNKALFRVAKNQEEKCISAVCYSRCNDENKATPSQQTVLTKFNRENAAEHRNKHAGSFGKSLKPRTVDNITSLWSGTRGNSFRAKGKTDTKKSTNESGLDSATRVAKQKTSLMNTSEAKLHPLQGMEFLEGFGKKKQQLHQRNHHQLNNLSSIHINPLTAQSSLNIHLHGTYVALHFANFILNFIF